MKNKQYKYTKSDLFGEVRNWHDWVEDVSYVLVIIACILVNIYIATLIYLALTR